MKGRLYLGLFVLALLLLAAGRTVADGLAVLVVPFKAKGTQQ